MEAITIEAQEREVGKKAARSVRRSGNVPCVLYGHHTAPVAFQVPELELNQLVYTTEAHVVEIRIDGDAFSCIMKDAVFHPVTDRAMHADFQVLEKGEKINLTIPIKLHGTPIGQKEGGDTQVVLHEVEVRCFPANIPSHIDLDISGLDIGDSIHIEDLITGDIELLGQPTQTVVTVVPPRVLEAEEEEDQVVLDEHGEIVDVEDIEGEGEETEGEKGEE
jgi:large subunit ribosomal protein L25